jgi:transcriptional regulator with XRE-family HTH domain
MPTTKKKPPILLDFGECVRQYRIARGYSQEAFADACEIDRSYMGGIERGERNLALINIIRIVQALGMEPSEFFRGLDSAQRQDMQHRRTVEKERRHLLKQVGTATRKRPKKPVEAL